MPKKGQYRFIVSKKLMELDYDALTKAKKEDLFVDFIYDEALHHIHKIQVVPSIDFGISQSIDQDSLRRLVEETDEVDKYINEQIVRDRAKGKNAKFSYDKTTAIRVHVKYFEEDLIFRGVFPRSKVTDSRGIPLEIIGRAQTGVVNVAIRTIINAFKKKKVEIVGDCLGQELYWVLPNHFRFNGLIQAGFEVYFVYENLAPKIKPKNDKYVSISLDAYRNKGAKVTHPTRKHVKAKIVTKTS